MRSIRVQDASASQGTSVRAAVGGLLVRRTKRNSQWRLVGVRLQVAESPTLRLRSPDRCCPSLGSYKHQWFRRPVTSSGDGSQPASSAVADPENSDGDGPASPSVSGPKSGPCSRPRIRIPGPGHGHNVLLLAPSAAYHLPPATDQPPRWLRRCRRRFPSASPGGWASRRRRRAWGRRSACTSGPSSRSRRSGPSARG